MHDGRAINDKACKCISVLVSKVSGPNVGFTAGYLGCIHILPFQTVFLRDEKLRQYNCPTSSAKTTTGLIIKIKPPQRAPGFEASFCRRPDHVITSTCDVLCLESTGLQNPVLNISLTTFPDLISATGGEVQCFPHCITEGEHRLAQS